MKSAAMMTRSIAVLLLCASCGATTAKQRTSYEVQVEGALPRAPNSFGWTVQLTSATANFEAIRFFSGKSLLSRFDPIRWVFPVAYAHPGHYEAGDTLGELLTPCSVNLLEGATWGTATGITGTYGSLQLTYAATGARLVGTATRANVTIPFDTGTFSAEKPIAGVKLEAVVGTEKGQVTVTVDLATWVDRIDFGTSDGGVPFESTSELFNGFARGVEDTSGYSGKWSTP